MNFTLLLNKVAFLYLLNSLTVCLLLQRRRKLWKASTNPFMILCKLLALFAGLWPCLYSVFPDPD